MINSEAAVCASCRSREKHLGQFLPQENDTYKCAPCVEIERVEKRLVRQEEYQKKFNRPDVKHGQLRPCVCGHKGRIDFDYDDSTVAAAFDNSIKLCLDGRWRCAWCSNKKRGSAGAS